MARLRKFLLVIILLIVIVVIITIFAAPLLPLTALEPAVEARLSELLGRKVKVDTLRLNLLGGTYLTIKGMTAQEDAAFGEEEFFKADQVRADVDITEYLRHRQIAIDAIRVKSAQINLIRNTDGSWNWTTLGRQPSGQSTASLLASKITSTSALTLMLPGELSSRSLRKIEIENASVKLTDRKVSDAPQTFYKNIKLDASLTPTGAEGSENSRQVTGQFTAQSEEDGEADMFKATFPFDFKIEHSGSSTLMVDGSIGPGPLETKNLSVGSFSINGQIGAEENAPMTGNGRLSVGQMFIRSINLSERMAGALRINQIGDMNPGTAVAELESEFNISQGAVETRGLIIREIDGLGDATAQTGRFVIDSGLSVSYPATVTLSADATSRVKSAGTMLGIITTILEMNNRISVPVNIDGDIRNPRISVDVSRIF